ncbi:hydroxymethylpyrimidine/phosphomethylpyrimidine kinase [Niveibacterium sp. SC-1]|uniref:bifunctional hydroxymethylpyrimidine kinase/phosphomethylpyrimidine kinase n=1 Tax=Niveibacterium sp. SC-1 TaxID=3135646 RepID=UPI00311FBCCB
MLCFAASDPTGGAGIAADILTVASLGGHPASVITGISARDTRGIEAFWSLDPDWVNEQARVLLEDMPIAAFKIGLAGTPEIAAVIAEIVADYPDIPVVLDPVAASGAEDPLAEEELIDAVCGLLIPLSTIVTPNRRELLRLAEEEDEDESPTPAECARRLLDLGAGHVLLTGAHESTPQIINTLFGPEGVVRADAWERLPGSFHGAGCTLAAALATRLAFGQELSAAVREAQDFTWHSLREGFQVGMGQHLPDRLFGLRG